jgi:hypothetical protein
MKRRELIQSIALVASFPLLWSSRKAYSAPPIIAGVSFVVSFFIQRYAVGRAMAWLIRTFPSLLASKERKYFIAALITLGIDNSVAAVVAEAAEIAGAENVARNGRELTTELKIENLSSIPLELPEIRIVLTDAATNIIEVESIATWGVVVPPETTAYRKIVATNFPKPGLKRWHLMIPEGSIAKSGTFLVV